MNVILNGEPREVPAGATVSTLLELLNLQSAVCAVEVNRAVVPKAQHADRPLSDGDAIEVVTLVGGG